MIDRVTAMLSRKLYEVPFGLKWFVEGLMVHLVLPERRAQGRLLSVSMVLR
jgi:hypothetical protein